MPPYLSDATPRPNRGRKSATSPPAVEPVVLCHSFSGATINDLGATDTQGHQSSPSTSTRSDGSASVSYRSSPVASCGSSISGSVRSVTGSPVGSQVTGSPAVSPPAICQQNQQVIHDISQDSITYENFNSSGQPPVDPNQAQFYPTVFYPHLGPLPAVLPPQPLPPPVPPGSVHLSPYSPHQQQLVFFAPQVPCPHSQGQYGQFYYHQYQPYQSPHAPTALLQPPLQTEQMYVGSQDHQDGHSQSPSPSMGLQQQQSAGPSTLGSGSPPTLGCAGPSTSGSGSPSTPGCAGPSTPGCTGHSSPGCAGPSSPGCAGPSSPGCAGPSTPGCTGPSSPGCAGPSTIGYADPSTPGCTDPSTLGHSQPQDIPTAPQQSTSPGDNQNITSPVPHKQGSPGQRSPGVEATAESPLVVGNAEDSTVYTVACMGEAPGGSVPGFMPGGGQWVNMVGSSYPYTVTLPVPTAFNPAAYGNYKPSADQQQHQYSHPSPALPAPASQDEPYSVAPPGGVAIMPHWRQVISISQQMELVWHGEFNSRFQTFVPHRWYLIPVDKPPSETAATLWPTDLYLPNVPWRTFRDSAKVRFCCDSCGNGWTSMKGRVIFWFFYNEKEGQGYVLFKLYGQCCKRCSNGQFEHAMWYPDEVVKVIENMYHRVGQVYYQFFRPPLRIERRSGKPKEQHNSELCQACKEGLCQEEMQFT